MIGQLNFGPEPRRIKNVSDPPVPVTRENVAINCIMHRCNVDMMTEVRRISPPYRIFGRKVSLLTGIFVSAHLLQGSELGHTPIFFLCARMLTLIVLETSTYYLLIYTYFKCLLALIKR